MSAVRILIVEDDPLIAEDLRGHLEALGYEVVAVCDNALDAMAELASHKPDLLLLDINLGDGADGIQLAEKVKAKHRMPFIFVTSHSDPGTLARVKPLRPAGFIIKPFDENELRAQIELALARYANDVEATAAPAEEQRTEFVIADSLFIRDKGRLVKVAIADILHAEADNNYTHIHTTRQRYTLSLTLGVVQERINDPRFVRVHRSHLVNTMHVTAVEEGYVCLGRLKLQVAKASKDELMSRLRTL